MTSITAIKWNALLATALAILAVSAAMMAMAVRNSDATNIKNVVAEEPQPVTARREVPRTDHKASGAVIEHATAETFANQVLRSPVPVLLDFYADWCGLCQIQDGILKEFAAEFEEGKIIKVNVDESPKLAARYDVQGLPTLLIFQEGKVVARQVGLATKKQLKAALAN